MVTISRGMAFPFHFGMLRASFRQAEGMFNAPRRSRVARLLLPHRPGPGGAEGAPGTDAVALARCDGADGGGIRLCRAAAATIPEGCAPGNRADAGTAGRDALAGRGSERLGPVRGDALAASERHRRSP